MDDILKYNTGHYNIDSGLKGFCAGVTGREINSINYDLTHNEVRKAEKRILSRITGVENPKIIMLDQVHGNRILHVVNIPSKDLPSSGEADGLITPIKGLVLVIRTADCVPVFLYDPVSEVLAAAHSGWKGTMLNIAGKCVRDMVYIYGSNPSEIRAYILPSIGPESYEVSDDVACHFPEHTIKSDEKLYVNLWGAVEGSLEKAGISRKNMFNTQICNRKNHTGFFSHRYGDKGRNLNYAYMK